jgi:cyclohexanecarboxylate-CoA ligase
VKPTSAVTSRSFPEPDAGRLAREEASGHWRATMVDEHLVEAATGFGERVGVIDRKGPHSFAELATMTAALATWMLRAGTRRGDVVSWMLPNWYEAFVVHFAIMRIGAVSNPILPNYGRQEVSFILDQAQPRILIVPETHRGVDHRERIDEYRFARPALEHVLVAGAGSSHAPALSDVLAEPAGPLHEVVVERSPNDPVLLLYTSGTTAEPKGVVHTHNTLECENRSMITFYELGPDTPVYMPSPVTHVTGLLYGIQLPPMIGAAAVYHERYEPREAFALLEQTGAAFTVAATPFLHRLAVHAGAGNASNRLRVFVCGGADVPRELVEMAELRLGCVVTRAYGSSECPTVTGGTRTDPLAKRAGTDGRLMEGVEARVVDDEGRVVGTGTVGELQVRAPELFIGYLDHRSDDTFDDEGWFATGDLVSIDEEGYLTVEGRKKDVIIRGGENISAKEVEDLLRRHPAVADVALVGMADQEMGERACAFIVTNDRVPPSLDELVEFLRGGGLAAFKLPERLEIIDELPKTPSGKLQRAALRGRIRQVGDVRDRAASPRDEKG